MITQFGNVSRNGYSAQDLGLLATERQVLRCMLMDRCQVDDVFPEIFCTDAHLAIAAAIDDLRAQGANATSEQVYRLLDVSGLYDTSEMSAVQLALDEIVRQDAEPENFAGYVLNLQNRVKRREYEEFGRELDRLLKSRAPISRLKAHLASFVTSTPEDRREEIQFFTGPALAQLDTTLTYLVDDVLVQGQPLLLAGTKKTLKTNISIDLTISLATGLPFLGQYRVPRAIRAGLMSAESGAATIKETAHRVAMSKGMNGVQDCPDALFAFSTPMISTAKECDRFRRIIEDKRLQFLNIAPTYLTFVIGDDGREKLVSDGRITFAAVTNRGTDRLHNLPVASQPQGGRQGREAARTGR